MCAYSLDQMDPNSYEEAFECICKYHSHLAPQEEDCLVEKGVDKTVQKAFGAPWIRVAIKLAH